MFMYWVIRIRSTMLYQNQINILCTYIHVHKHLFTYCRFLLLDYIVPVSRFFCYLYRMIKTLEHLIGASTVVKGVSAVRVRARVRVRIKVRVRVRVRVRLNVRYVTACKIWRAPPVPPEPRACLAHSPRPMRAELHPSFSSSP